MSRKSRWVLVPCTILASCVFLMGQGCPAEMPLPGPIGPAGPAGTAGAMGTMGTTGSIGPAGVSPFMTAANGTDIFYNTGNVGIGTTLPEVKLHIIGGSDVNPVSGGFLQMGATGGTNIALSNNEIMARNNGVVSTLFLNAEGGAVLINNQHAATGDEAIRIIRGTVGATAFVNRGTGWTVARTAGEATGDYTITFTTAFSNFPVVTATAIDNNVMDTAVVHGTVLTPTTTRIRTFSAAAVLVDSDFNFIAIGPR